MTAPERFKRAKYVFPVPDSECELVSNAEIQSLRQMRREVDAAPPPRVIPPPLWIPLAAMFLGFLLGRLV